MNRLKTMLLVVTSAAAYAASAQAITTLVVPYTAGGAVDNVARIVAQKITDQTGEVFVIENRAGTNGVVGAKVVAKAKPDGKTWMFAADAVLSVNPFLYPRDPNFTPETDLRIVRGVAFQQSLLFVNQNFPAKNVKEFVQYARQNEVTYGSAGIGSPSHLTMELFGSETGLKLIHVPYKGGPPAMVDLLGGRIQASFAAIPIALPYVQSGKVVPLAVAAPVRSPQLANVPTMNEEGFPGIEVETAAFVVLPGQTPADIAAKVEAMIARALADPVVQQRILAVGWTPAQDMTSSEALHWITRAKRRWGHVIREKGIKAE